MGDGGRGKKKEKGEVMRVREGDKREKGNGVKKG